LAAGGSMVHPQVLSWRASYSYAYITEFNWFFSLLIDNECLNQ
jgi:hypothetical protein